MIAAAAVSGLAPRVMARTYTNSRGLVLDVPYVATSEPLVARMLDMANTGPNDILYDLGCGDGRIVVAAVRDRNVRRAIGIDLDPKRIAEANANAEDAKVTARTRFVEGNLIGFDFHDATVVTMYLLPDVIAQIRPKILALAPGARVVSHAFDMGDWPADRTEKIGDATLYAWTVPAAVAGVWDGQRRDGAPLTLRLEQRFQTIRGTLRVKDGAAHPVRGRLEGDRLRLAEVPRVGGLALAPEGRIAGDTLTLADGTTARRSG